jgi:hypothetical protein
VNSLSSALINLEWDPISQYEVSNIFIYSLKTVSPTFYEKIAYLAFRLVNDPTSALQHVIRSLLSLKYQFNRSSQRT